MKDVVVVLMTLGFFAVCVAYVVLCDRIVGPDEQDGETDPSASTGAGAGGVDPVVAGGATADPALLATGGTKVAQPGEPGVTR